jgi:hypothetical protein
MSYMGVQMARRGGHNGPIDDGLDKAVTVRPSSTANFFVDSLDKGTLGTSTDFVINKDQALFNGFFNRIAVNEVVMDWGLPNIARWWGNNFLTVSVNPGGGATLGTTYTVTIPDGFYSAIDLMRTVCALLNAASGQTATFSVDAVTTNTTQVGIKSTQEFLVVWEQTATGTVPALSRPFYDPKNALARGLFSSSQLYQVGPNVLPAPIVAAQFSLTQVVLAPLVLGTRYVDFVSPQLTYNQQLKDNTTAQYPRDVLYRWYFAWDTQSGVNSIVPSTPPAPTSNALFPYYVYQGYGPFNQRRILPYPKQILWENQQPLGQVAFQVYDDRGRLLDTSKFTPSANFQFQMSMLLSEN